MVHIMALSLSEPMMAWFILLYASLSLNGLIFMCLIILKKPMYVFSLCHFFVSIWCRLLKFTLMRDKDIYSMYTVSYLLVTWGGHFKNTYKLLNPRAMKVSTRYRNSIFQYMGKIFCVEFQREPLKFCTKSLTLTLKDVYFIQTCNFKSS